MLSSKNISFIQEIFIGPTVCPAVEKMKSLIVHSHGCTETGCVFGETRHANIEVKIVTKELNCNSRYFAAVTYAPTEEFQKREHLLGWSRRLHLWGGSCGFGRLGSGKREEERRHGDMTFPDRWRCSHLSLHAELCGAKSSTSRTCWHFGGISCLLSDGESRLTYWKEDCTMS